MEDVFDKIKGRIETYDVIVIGHLKWNPYFGESKEAPPRGDPSTCTSTMVRGLQEDGTPFVLLIDPTLRLTPEDYYFDINRRTGLRPEDVTHCFSTHSHYDHQAGLAYFPNAVWMAGEGVARELQDSKWIDGTRVKGVEGEFLPGVYAVSLPGHVKHLYGAAFWDGDWRVVAAGDGVMTKYHFWDGTTMFEEDAVMAEKTIQGLHEITDLVIPGHDNLIVNHRGGGDHG